MQFIYFYIIFIFKFIDLQWQNPDGWSMYMTHHSFPLLDTFSQKLVLLLKQRRHRGIFRKAEEKESG